MSSPRPIAFLDRDAVINLDEFAAQFLESTGKA
jgi:hypothetical protein